jgi:predicted permease
VEFLAQATTLFGSVIFPILLIVGLGTLVQKYHPIDIGSLSKLQIYLFIPAFLFVRVFDSTLSWGEIGSIAGAVLLAKLALALPLGLLLLRLKVSREKLPVILLSSALFNAGNFGIPVAERAFGAQGGAVQALVVMVANFSLFTIGYGLMSLLAGQGIKQAILSYLKLPTGYALVAALALRGFGVHLPNSILYALHTIADGLVPLALLTLGLQLKQQARWPHWKAVAPVLVLKLLVMPAVTAAIVLLLGLWPWPGAMLIVAAAGPTAVNIMLLTIEQKGDVELAADCVFWATLLSAITVTVVLTLVKALGGGPPLPG